MMPNAWEDRMRAILLGLGLVLAGPASGAELYCLAEAVVNGNVSPPLLLTPETGPHANSGWSEFWVDTETGDWRYRTIGSAALYSDGGIFVIAADGTGYRQHWVGIEDHGGFETLRIDREREPMHFQRADRDGFVEFGSSIKTAGRTFIDGVERPQ
jgi:hypothetical protein